MTGNRVLAIFLAACALAASALIAIPIDGAEAPDASYTASVPVLAAGPKSLPPQAAQGAEASDETHDSLPRLWLGGH